MRSLSHTVLVAVLSTMALVLVAGTGAAQADEPGDAGAPSMTFEQPVARDGGRISVGVRLATSSGDPVTRQPVEFFVTPDFLGERPVFIHTALTNNDGIASVNYEPTWDGEHRITARYAGDDTYQSVEATSVLQLAGVPAIELFSDERLSPLRKWAAPATIAVVLIVWLTLAVVVIRVCWGIWAAGSRGGPQHIPAYETAAATPPGGTHSPHTSIDVGSRTWHGPGALSTGDDSRRSDTQ